MLHIVRIFVLIPLLVAAALRGQAHDAHAQTTETQTTETQTTGTHATERSTMAMPERDFFVNQYAHLVPHALWTPALSPDPARNELLTFYNVNLFQLGVVAFIFVLFTLVRASFHAGDRTRSPWLVRVFRGWCLWIRDEMVLPVLGPKYGPQLTPYFIFLFFFIAFLNLASLVPGSLTAMATVFVTGALALQSFVLIVGMGIKEQGLGGFVRHLVAPPGIPAIVLPIMAPVEILSLFVRPLALMIRLFANLLAGHMALYSFIGMMFVFAKMMKMGFFAYVTAIPAIGLAIFVNILESFIVILQAYVFAYLTLIFMGQMVQHADHGAH